MTEALRIAVVLGRNGAGGSEQQTKLLTRGLREAGHDVDVVLVEPSGGTEGFGSARVRSLSHHRDAGVRGLLSLLASILELRRMLSSSDYDVVHAVMARAYVLVPLSLLLSRSRPSIIAWRRNEAVHLESRPVAAAVERCAARLTDKVICNSRAVRDYWVDRGHLLPGRTHVVSNAIEPWRFDSVPDAHEPCNVAGRRVVSVGGLKPVKNHALLIESIANTGRDIEAVLLGDGEMHDQLRSKADALGVNLILAGHQDDPRGWLSSADLYVHSSDSEGMSNAILEAMALGCAIVATDVGAAGELLGGGGGVIVPPRDAEAMAAAILTLLDDESARTAMGLAARGRAKRGFALESVVDRHLEIYRDAIGARNG